MKISDISIHRPVLATVGSLLLVVLGVIAFTRLPLRELPVIDPPVVSINTTYTGASAAVMETRVTKVLRRCPASRRGHAALGEREQRFQHQHRVHPRPRHRAPPTTCATR